MTTGQYGQYTLYLSWISVLSVFATLSLAGAVFDSGLLDYREDRKVYTSAMQGLSTTAALAVVVCCFLLRPLWRRVIGLPDIIIYVMLAEMLFIPGFQYWAASQRFYYRYKALAAVTLSAAALQSGIGVAAVMCAQEKGIARALSAAIVNILLGLCFYIYNFASGRKFFIKKYWIFALKFNLPLIPYYLSQFILMQSDRIMIAYYFSQSEAGIYGLACQIAMIMNVVTEAVLASFVPWLYRSMREERYLRIRQVTNALLVMMSVAVFIPVLLAPEVILLLGTGKYMEGVWIIPPVAASVFYIFFTWFFIRIEFYFQETKFVAVSTVFSALLNIILNMALIPKFGYIAAAYTTLVCYMAYAATHYLFMRFVCAKHGAPRDLYNIKVILALSVLVPAGAALAMLTYAGRLLRWGLIAGVCICAVLFRKKIYGFMKKLIGERSMSD